MRCLTHTLLRRVSCLSPQCVPGRWSQILSPKRSSLRQSCSAKPGVMTATDVVNCWQKVFETNGIPEARESSEYIVSFVLGAKTFQSLSSKSLHTPLTAVQQEQIQQLSNKRLERSLMKMLCYIGPTVDPRGTPLVICLQLDFTLLNTGLQTFQYECQCSMYLVSGTFRT